MLKSFLHPKISGSRELVKPCSVKGDKGNTGANGTNGTNGINGTNGADGAKGDKGDKGDQGDPGAQGEQGIQGIQGEQGPKAGDSIITNEHGTYAVGICEGTQGQWFDMIPAHAPTDPRFVAAVVQPFRFPSVCGTMHLCVGVPKHCKDWRLPDKTPDQRDRSRKMWREIADGTLGQHP